jgi:flagellar hook assembly protein FlgD
LDNPGPDGRTAEVRISFSGNPFQSTVTINVENILPGFSRQVQMQIINAAGKTVFAKNFITRNSLLWGGRDQQGKQLSQGVYYVRVTNAGKVLGQKKLILLR